MEEHNCSTCRYFGMGCPILPCNQCKETVATCESKWEAFTVADYIRGLSNEELASYIAGLLTGYREADVTPVEVLDKISEPYQKLHTV